MDADKEAAVDEQEDQEAAVAASAAESEDAVEDEQEESSKENDGEEIQVTIGDGSPPEPDLEVERAPQWVRELRKSHRELQRKVREYEQKEAAPAAAPLLVAQTLPAKPTLEGYEYDSEKYEAALESWYRQREQIEQAKREAERKSAEERAAWQIKLDAYAAAKKKLKVRDFEDAEAVIEESFNPTQQGVMLQSSPDNPALLVYALGKNPKRAKELSKITDPVQFAFALGKLETQLKVQSRPKPPAPEKGVPVGTAAVGASADSTLERLRDEAARTGDMTKVMRYKAQLKAKKSA